MGRVTRSQGQSGQCQGQPYVISPQHGRVEGQQLHGDDRQHGLQAVHCVRHRYELTRLRLRVNIILVANKNGPPLKDVFEKRGLVYAS